jgi:hypothetical protein
VATGERFRKRTAETRSALTSQEAHIAALTAEGLTNRQIAAPTLHQRKYGRVPLAKGLSEAGSGVSHPATSKPAEGIGDTDKSVDSDRT